MGVAGPPLGVLLTSHATKLTLSLHGPVSGPIRPFNGGLWGEDCHWGTLPHFT